MAERSSCCLLGHKVFSARPLFPASDLAEPTTWEALEGRQLGQVDWTSPRLPEVESSGLMHYEILHYFGTRFASALVVISDLIV